MERELVAVKDKVIAKIIRQENITKGGIIVPETVDKDPQGYGEVISAGEEVSEKIKTGQVILFHKHGGQDIMVDGIIYKVLVDKEVYGILKEKTL